MNNRVFLFVTVVTILFRSQQPVYAQDWNQWRGPSRDGVVPVENAPETWGESYKQVWRIDAGEGYSSPVVDGERAFIHFRRDPDEVVAAVNIADGGLLWEQTYPAVFEKNKYAANMAKGPNATPLVVDGRLFTLGVTGIFTAWGIENGKPLWSKDFSGAIDTSKMFCGTSASPLLVNGLVVVQVGSDVHGGKIIAFDPASGEARWEWSGAGPGYASPVLIEVDGVAQIVTMTDQSVISIDAKTGAELWSTPFPDQWHENIMTPLWTGELLIVSGTRQGTHAYRLEQENGEWTVHEVWKNDDVAMYMSSPVYGDGLVYGHSNKRRGQFFALDPKTGEVRWTAEGRGDHASVLLTPKHILFLTTNAQLTVAKRGTEAFEIEQRYDVAEAETWAMPALLGEDLLLRDSAGLMRLTPDE